MAEFTLGQVAIVNKGAYSGSTSYVPLNMVTNLGGSFMCIAPCTGSEPGVTSGWNTYWVPMAKGIKTYALSVSGSTATVNITFTDGTTYSTTYSTAAVGSNSVGTGALQSKCVTTAKIADGAVGSTQLASDLTPSVVGLTADQTIPIYKVNSVGQVGSSGDGIYLVKGSAS